MASACTRYYMFLLLLFLFLGTQRGQCRVDAPVSLMPSGSLLTAQYTISNYRNCNVVTTAVQCRKGLTLGNHILNEYCTHKPRKQNPIRFGPQSENKGYAARFIPIEGQDSEVHRNPCSYRVGPEGSRAALTSVAELYAHLIIAEQVITRGTNTADGMAFICHFSVCKGLESGGSSIEKYNAPQINQCRSAKGVISPTTPLPPCEVQALHSIALEPEKDGW